MLLLYTASYFFLLLTIIFNIHIAGFVQLRDKFIVPFRILSGFTRYGLHRRRRHACRLCLAVRHVSKQVISCKY